MRHAMLSFCALTTATAVASAQTWNFSGPDFAEGQYTPITNAAANIPGPVPITASFSTMGGSMFVTSSGPGSPNPLMVGQFLRVDFTISQAVVLVVAFSQPVTAVSFDFAVYTQSPGTSFRVQTPAGITNYAATNVGGVFWGGHVDYTNPVPFTAVILYGIRNSSGVPFIIDNLSVTVPTPGAAAALALAGTTLIRRRRH